ncbi:MAG TPA: hypothetical protein VHB97_27500 [Polyangia bacterium]|nr:hypothetical protein [Polyangia bacterium]
MFAGLVFVVFGLGLMAAAAAFMVGGSGSRTDAANLMWLAVGAAMACAGLAAIVTGLPSRNAKT